MVLKEVLLRPVESEKWASLVALREAPSMEQARPAEVEACLALELEEEHLALELEEAVVN